MTDRQEFSELLERDADRIPVGPPPIAQMLTRVDKRRRRRNALTIAASSATVIAIVFGAAALSDIGNNAERRAAPRAAASPPPTSSSSSTALNGDWTVRELLDRDGRSTLTSSYATKVRMTFEGGRMTGDTGCNSISGNYRQTGDQGQDLMFSRGNLMSTAVGCRNEPPLLPRLLDVRHVSGSADIRYLRDADGTVVLELRRASIKTPPTGEVTGRLFRIGGPYPGDPSALSHGTVRFKGASPSVADVDGDGYFTARLKPGSYEVTATSPEYKSGHGTCETGHPVQVLANRKAAVNVYCQLR